MIPNALLVFDFPHLLAYNLYISSWLWCCCTLYTLTKNSVTFYFRTPSNTPGRGTKQYSSFGRSTSKASVKSSTLPPNAKPPKQTITTYITVTICNGWHLSDDIYLPDNHLLILCYTCHVNHCIIWTPGNTCQHHHLLNVMLTMAVTSLYMM